MATNVRRSSKRVGYCLSGRVRVRERKIGIPDLVVAFFDGEGNPSLRATGGRPVVLSRKHVSGLQSRLGSVLTEADGSFSFKFEAIAAQLPDIIVIVYAPEDSGSLESPIPLSDADRVLHISRSPRMDIGQSEAYVIRIPEEHLNSFGIFLGPRASSPDRAMDPQSRVEQSLETRKRFRDFLTTRLAPERERSQKHAALAAAAISSLSGIPAHRRNAAVLDSTYHISDRSQLAEKLPKLQVKAFNQGVEQMARRRATSAAMRLRLKPEELSELGLHVKDGEVQGTPDPEKLRQIARARSGGVDLIKYRGLRNPSVEELERKYLRPSKKDS